MLLVPNNCSVTCNFFLLFSNKKILFLCQRKRVRTSRGCGRQRESGLLTEWGLDPGTPGSRLELKAGSSPTEPPRGPCNSFSSCSSGFCQLQHL